MMNYVALDVGNLKTVAGGTIAPYNAATARRVNQNGGIIVYFSDRRAITRTSDGTVKAWKPASTGSRTSSIR